MKLLSVRQLVVSAQAAAGRFPETVACGAIAAFAGATGVDAANEMFWFRIFFAASLGLPLFVAVTLASERLSWSLATRVGVGAAGAALLGVLYWGFVGWPDDALGQRYFHLAATLHLAVAVIPYAGIRDPWGFWQFNRAVFFRFVLAAIYAAAVFVGLALALAALDNLLGIEIADENYGRLWFAAAFVLHPLVFLAGMPKDYAALGESRDYPPQLKVFSQNVMLPLVALYIAILLTYMGKILVTGTWPSGWISYLVSGLAVAGIFSLLMVHPARMQSKDSWIDRYALGFWIAILPSSAMVLLALWQRFEQYGITERRYLLGVLAVWLGGTALHRVITRTHEIKEIPLSLAIAGALSFVGPWSAYSVAERSQLGRIEQILEAQGVALPGDSPAEGPGAQRPAAELRQIPFEDWQQVRDAVTYLLDNHGPGAFDRWEVVFSDTTGASADADGADADDAAAYAEAAAALRDARMRSVITALGVRPGLSVRPVEVRAAAPQNAFATAGFDVLATGVIRDAAIVAGERLWIRLGADGVSLVVTHGSDESAVSLEPILARIQEQREQAAAGALEWGAWDYDIESIELPGSELALDVEIGGRSARVLLGYLLIEQPAGEQPAGEEPAGEEPVVTDFEADGVLLRLEEDPGTP